MGQYLNIASTMGQYATTTTTTATTAATNITVAAATTTAAAAAAARLLVNAVNAAATTTAAAAATTTTTTAAGSGPVLRGVAGVCEEGRGGVRLHHGGLRTPGGLRLLLDAHRCCRTRRHRRLRCGHGRLHRRHHLRRLRSARHASQVHRHLGCGLVNMVLALS